MGFQRPGFQRGRNLEKLGLKGQDTSELFFEDCRVPIENRLGEEGQGFKLLMSQLQQERLTIAVGSMASCRRSLEDTLAYVREREAFGQRIAQLELGVLRILQGVNKCLTTLDELDGPVQRALGMGIEETLIANLFWDRFHQVLEAASFLTQHLRRRDAAVVEMAVSYTHLTLPTILLV